MDPVEAAVKDGVQREAHNVKGQVIKTQADNTENTILVISMYYNTVLILNIKLSNYGGSTVLQSYPKSLALFLNLYLSIKKKNYILRCVL